MKINNRLYENLTPRQRIIATIEAKAREDHNEVDRLISTCPKVSYKGNDVKYADEIEALLSKAYAVEADLRGEALNYLIAMRSAQHCEASDNHIQNIADMKQAWSEVLESYGLDFNKMQGAICARHPALEVLYKKLPDADAEGVEAFKKVVTSGLS